MKQCDASFTIGLKLNGAGDGLPGKAFQKL